MLLTEFINTKCFVDLKGKKNSQNLRVCKELFNKRYELHTILFHTIHNIFTKLINYDFYVI